MKMRATHGYQRSYSNFGSLHQTLWGCSHLMPGSVFCILRIPLQFNETERVYQVPTELNKLQEAAPSSQGLSKPLYEGIVSFSTYKLGSSPMRALREIKEFKSSLTELREDRRIPSGLVTAENKESETFSIEKRRKHTHRVRQRGGI